MARPASLSSAHWESVSVSMKSRIDGFRRDGLTLRAKHRDNKPLTNVITVVDSLRGIIG